LTSFERSRAVALGAVVCDRTAIIMVLRQVQRAIARAA
jgi:hypothetical protein